MPTVAITEFPRALVRQGLRGLRLPLEVAETVARRAGVDIDETWLPAVAYEGFEADAKRLLGSLLRDDELIQDGRRQRARAAELRQAMSLQALAEGTRARADARLKARRQAATEQREAISEAAQEQEQKVREQRARAKGRVRREAEGRKRAVEEIEAERDEAVNEIEREARRRQLAEETAALEKERRAVEAKGRARALADAEEQVKELRKEEA
ncbi:MAG TPA: hypothetical protein VE991_08415 [Acidimicrobiales bacterium]|nr:hypothetical protein [Acidimicrobiales bacterium]